MEMFGSEVGTARGEAKIDVVSREEKVVRKE